MQTPQHKTPTTYRPNPKPQRLTEQMHTLRRHVISVVRHSAPTVASAGKVFFSSRGSRGGFGGGRGGGGGRRSTSYGSGSDDEDDSDSWSKPRGGGRNRAPVVPEPGLGVGDASITSWSTGLTRDDLDGTIIGRAADPFAPPPPVPEAAAGGGGDWERELGKDNRKDRTFVDQWEERWKDTCGLLKQVREPGARGEALKEEEKKEMYRLHKENPEMYNVERLAKDFRVLRQRVHAILWLKELEEQEEKKTGKVLDDSIERLIDACPEFFISHDKEFHVASLPYKPDFRVMPVDWDGTTKDPDEVLYEISMKEDGMLYREFVENMSFNKKKISGEVFHHKYSRRRPQKGWNITIEKLGSLDKCRSGSAFRFVSMPDGSSRELNELEKMYARRETPRRRRRILP